MNWLVDRKKKKKRESLTPTSSHLAAQVTCWRGRRRKATAGWGWTLTPTPTPPMKPSEWSKGWRTRCESTPSTASACPVTVRPRSPSCQWVSGVVYSQHTSHRQADSDVRSDGAEVAPHLLLLRFPSNWSLHFTRVHVGSGWPMTTFAVCQQTVCTTVSFSCHAVVTVECAVCHVNSDDRLDLLVYKEKAKVFFFGSTATSKKRQIPILVRPFVRLHRF